MQIRKDIPKYFKSSCLLIIGLLAILVLVKPMQAQSDNNQKINFSANDERLSIVLYRLSNEADLNFTYNSAEDIFDVKLNYSAVGKQPLVILEELLSATNYTFKQIGNQIVIHKKINRNNNISSNEIVIANEIVNNDIPTHKVIPDTVFVQDTVFSIHTDTIRITDTIYLEKEKTKKPTITKLKEIPSDYFNPTASREKGWSASVFVVPIISNFSLAQESGNISFRNFSFGIEVSKIHNNWNFSGGLKLTQFSEKFNHSYNVTEGGYYIQDTIDSYYTVIQTDTAWYYITDSTWKPIDNREYSYNINNRVGFIEFVGSLSFDYFSNRKFRLYIKAGGQAGILVYKNGLAIPDESSHIGVDFADLNFSTTAFSVLLGTGIKYRINKQFDFNAEVYYLNYFTDLVVDYPNNTKIQGVGIKFGLMYYF
ncbi:MAG: hypothetical protein QM503_15500 [Bacteroidota bacterium]